MPLEGGHETVDITAGLKLKRLTAREGNGQRPPGFGDFGADSCDPGDVHGAQMIVDLAEHRIGRPYVQRLRIEAQDDRGIKRHVGPLLVAVSGSARRRTSDQVVPKRAEPAREAHRGADPGIDRGAQRRPADLLRQGRDQILVLDVYCAPPEQTAAGLRRDLS